METNELFYSNPLPPLAERLEIIEIIRDHLKITPEQLNEILKKICLIYKPEAPKNFPGWQDCGFIEVDPVNSEPECYEYGFAGALIRDQQAKERSENNPHLRNLYEISQALTWPENMEITLKFADQNINVTNPKIREDVFNLLKAMNPPQAPPPKAGPGNPSKFSIKDFKIDIIRFLKPFMPQGLIKTDQLYFCALVMAYIGAIKTPAQLNKSERSGEPLKEFRKKFTDQLRTYSK